MCNLGCAGKAGLGRGGSTRKTPSSHSACCFWPSQVGGWWPMQGGALVVDLFFL
jgi:hypothetical protein